MRCHGRLAIFVFLSAIAVPACAYSPSDNAPDQQSIAELQAKIGQAEPRERCFLYAKLIHQMTEYSLRQHAAGDEAKTNELLVQVQTLAANLHLTVGGSDKRLKNAEILLRQAAFRLKELLRSSSFEDRPLVEETLAKVNKADDATMMQLFQK